MKQLNDIQQWYQGLQQRERYLVLSAAVVIIITLLYISIWEPIHKGVEEQTQRYQNQLKILSWMQNASAEARALRASGTPSKRLNSSQPVTLLVERSAQSAGLRKYVSKLESTSDKGARVTIAAASFDQMLLWLNTLQSQYGITVSSASLDRENKPGTVNARLTLNRS